MYLKIKNNSKKGCKFCNDTSKFTTKNSTNQIFISALWYTLATIIFVIRFGRTCFTGSAKYPPDQKTKTIY